jgi:hypothetical protein
MPLRKSGQENNRMSQNTVYRRILSRMGYYNYQRGLIYHHLNEEGSWNTHLKNCRNFVLKSLEYNKPSVVTVLGSGWLLDLPIREMAGQVDIVNLVDIVHPPEVRNQSAELKNIVLIEEDISGGLIQEVWNRTRHRSFLNRLRALDGIKVPAYKPEYEVGMIVSLNILTQLESLPVEWLKKKSMAGEEDFVYFRKEIQENHISLLKQYNSVLITDISEVITEKAGNVYDRKTVVAQLPEPEFKEEWTWDFEPRDSDYYRKKSNFKVIAMFLQNEPARDQK